MTLEKLKMRLRVLQGQTNKSKERMAGHKENTAELHESIQKQLRKVEKLDSYIENRILNTKHSEL